MGVVVAIALVVAATLVISKIGDWFDSKTGWVIGAIIATAVGTYLMASLLQAHRDSIQPRPAPICKQVGTC
jgi:low affinity Fe/Cu permease